MTENFVLVHGAWHGGWSWQPVASRLRAAGHRVWAPTCPGLGIDNDPRGVTLAFLESSGKTATIREPLAPVAAYDGTGRDVLAALAARDGLNWESDVAALLAASRTIDELRLTFPKPAGASTAKLLLRAKNSRLGTRIRQDLVRLRGRDAGSWYADLAGSRRSAERSQPGCLTPGAGRLASRAAECPPPSR